MENTDAERIARTGFTRFTHGLATADWEPFLAMTTEDFRFWFPVGAFQGENQGQARAREFFALVSQVFAPGFHLDCQRVSVSQGEALTTVVFEGQAEGTMFGQPYRNQAAVSFDVRGEKICGYREYLSVHYPR